MLITYQDIIANADSLKVTSGKIAVTEKAVELEGAEFVIGNAEAVAGDTVDVAINYTTDLPADPPVHSLWQDYIPHRKSVPLVPVP